MLIGIAASAAFKKNRTGVEEYAYQFIKHLAMLPESREHQFFLYVAPNQRIRQSIANLRMLSNFKIKELSAPFFWTQGRLSLEMLFDKLDVLFAPGHVLPIFHPKNSVVTIHGLEFEYFPEFYPILHLKYLKWATKYAANHAKKIIAVSQNTKDDLIMFYGVNPKKITVIHHGISMSPITYENQRKHQWDYALPYILFLGTKEKKKNISGLIKAFNFLKEKYNIPHKLILAGGRPNKKFYKGENIKKDIGDLKCQEDIINLDFVSEEEKWNLLKNAQVFIYPSFYEGFGMPILEAQSVGVPVITSDVSALPEVAGNGALSVDPKSIEEMAQAIYKVIKNKDLRNEFIKMGYENIKRFSWEKCARETLNVITNQSQI